jgi:hypothetical protein
MFAGSTILYKMLVCLSESRGGSSYGESIFSYCGQRYSGCIFMYIYTNTQLLQTHN